MTGQNLIKHSLPQKKAVEIKRAGRQIRHLAQSIVLEESGTSSLVRSAMMVTSGSVMTFLIWSGFTKIDEVAVTLGAIMPSGQIQTVQHLEGGIVNEILVRDGELVEPGQPLVRLSQTQALSELEQMRAREATLLLRSERLRAFADGREPDFTIVAAGFEHLAIDQLAIMKAQDLARLSARAVIEAQVEQRRSDIRLYEEQLKAVGHQLEMVSQETAMREELLARQLGTRLSLVEIQRELARVQADRARLLGQLGTAQQALGESKSRLLDHQATLYKTTLDELGTVTAELAQVQESMGRLEDRVNRLDVGSPVRGLVQGLKVVNAGSVIQPGGIITQIVPVDQDLLVETRITTRDIGFVAVGQTATVKVSTYDSGRYGNIKGKLTGISPTTFLDEQGQPYYRGLIALETNYVGKNPAKNHVLPGMTVSAEITTGQKTLLQYLLKPVYVSLAQSFRER